MLTRNRCYKKRLCYFFWTKPLVCGIIRHINALNAVVLLATRRGFARWCLC
jgi:hypothetical protein